MSSPPHHVLDPGGAHSQQRWAPSPVMPEDQTRADLYALAARLLLARPDPEFLEALADAGPLPGRSPDTTLDFEWEKLTQAAAAMPADLVAEEFSALFEGLGSPLIDPYASVYLAGFMMEKPLARLRADLAALGLGRAAGASMPEDHLGALCETMRLLIAGAPDFAPLPLARQRAFFQRHLGAWTDRCLDEISSAAEANFYRRVAAFVRALLVVERGAFELADESADESTDELADEPVDKPADKPGDGTEDRPGTR